MDLLLLLYHVRIIIIGWGVSVMANLPAVCDNCGTVFKSGISFSGGGTLISVGGKSGPCPKCGGMGSVPDGVYKTIEGLIRELVETQPSQEQLQKLSKILEDTKLDGQTDIKDRIEAKAPEFSGLLKYLPQTREERINYVFFFVSTILAIIGMMQNVSNTTNVTNINVEQVINHIYQSEGARGYPDGPIIHGGSPVKEFPQVKNTPIKVEKIGRNVPCPCGSGLKYKKCHGK